MKVTTTGAGLGLGASIWLPQDVNSLPDENQDQLQINREEGSFSFMCRWFGSGCEMPQGAAPAAPQTKEQMTVPGAWTPEMSQTATAEENFRRTGNYFGKVETAGGFATPGTAAIDDAVNTAKNMGYMLLAALAVVGFIALKR